MTSEDQESVQGRAFNVIRAQEFGLTVEDVERTINDLRTNIEKVTPGLDDPDDNKRSSSQRALSRSKQMLEAFTAGTPGEILEHIRAIYNKAVSLENGHQREDDAIKQIRHEFPNLTLYYWLLSERRWGYALGQKISAYAARSPEPK